MFRTNMRLIAAAGIFMTGWCVSVKGMSLGAAESTRSGRRRRPSIHNKANSLGQINKYSKVFFCWEFHPRRPCGSHSEGEEMRFSLFFVLKLSLNSQPLTAILVFHSGPT